jgi:hypothetical protein
MTNAKSLKSQRSQGMAMAGGTSADRRRGRTFFILGAVALAIAVVAGLAAWFGAAPSPANETATNNAEADRLGQIVRKSGANKCEQMTFNNSTGQISGGSPAPCAGDIVLDAKGTSDTVLDAKGVPVPQGTAHTLKAISNSFK